MRRTAMFQIGASLRQARLARGLELAAVEKATRIRLKYLQALEEERFHVLPAEAYAKGFLREYSEFLGLDSRLFLDEFDARCATHAEPPIVPPRHAQPLPLLPSRGRAVLVAVLVLVAAAAAFVALGLHGSSRRPHPHTAPPAAAMWTVRLASAAAPARPSVHRPAPTRVPVPSLLLRASRGSCWLLVRRGSASGPKLYEGTLTPGVSVRFAGRRIWLRAGAAGNLDAWFGGKPVQTLPPGVGNVVFDASH